MTLFGQLMVSALVNSGSPRLQQKAKIAKTRTPQYGVDLNYKASNTTWSASTAALDGTARRFERQIAKER